MLQLRLRLVKDDGTTDATSRVLDTLDIGYTPFLSASGTLTFKVSRTTFVPAAMPFLVRVEYAVDGGRYQPLPEHELFICEEDADDSKDQAEVVTYTGTEFVPWLLAGAYVGTGPWEKDGERTINGEGALANAGQTMAYFIDESKSRGWLTPLQRGFNSLTDSAGAAWTAADRTSIAWRLETFYPRMLEQLTEQGWCDWSTQGRTLHLYRPGTRGTDRTQEIVFGGPEFGRVPVKTDATGWYTHVLGLSDAGRVHVSNAAAEARFGRRSAVMTQSGVKDTATSQKLAQTLLADGQTVKREEAYEWTPAEGGLHPFEDFLLGDLVTARSRGGKQARRIIGMVVRQGTGPATVQVRVGEKISTLAARTQKRLGQVSVGGVIGGSGAAFPASPGMPDAAPDAPDALMVTSNTGAWRDDGTAVSTVVLSWQPVTATPDGAEIDVTGYEVWSRLPSGALALDTIVTGTTATITSWEPGTARLVVVVAISAKGVKSAASLEVPVTPVMPSSVVPKPPTGLIVVSNVGGWTPAGPIATVVLACDPVTESTDDAPATAAEYEWRAGDAPALRTPGPSVTVSVPSGVAREYRVLAITAAGVRGDLSDPEEVTGADPGTASRAPSAPILTSGSGVLVARWDGTYTGGGTVGALAVWVEARLAPGEWVRQGAALTGPGSQLVRIGSIGDDVDVRLVASDQLGRETGASAVVTAEILGIDGDDIIAGTFHGNRLIVGTVEADSLAPSVGEQLNLSANSAIVLMAGRLDDQETQITQTAQDLDVVRGDLDDAAQSASEAAAAAAVADGKAVVAQQRADNANARMDDQAARFVVTPTGADVASLDAASIFRITPSGAQIIQGGTPASQWTAGQFIVSEAIVSRAQLGNHVVEKSGMRTVIRAL